MNKPYLPTGPTSRLAAFSGLAASLGLAALGGAPGCDGGDTSSQGGGGGTTTTSSGGGGAGGQGAGPIFIDPAKCLSIGAENEVGPEDPTAQGQCLFLLETWGTEVLDDWPPVEFILDLMVTEPDVFGDQLAKFGFLPDPNDDLPIGLKRGQADPSRLRETCALCHVGKLPDGRTWLGAPNVALDMGRFRVELDARWVAAGNPPLLTELAKKKALGLGPGRTGAESSNYPYLVGADFPPYFSLATRKNLNYIGTGRDVRTEVFFSIYSAGAGSPNAETAKVPFPTDEHVNTFLAFFGEMQPPAAPAQDAALVAKGKAVFDAEKCGSCHHPEDLGLDEMVTYDKTPDAKEKLPGEDPDFPRGTIRTDVLHRVLLDPSVGPQGGSGGSGGAGGSGGSGGTGGEGGAPGTDSGYADLIAFLVEHKLSIAQTDGYRPSDLRALWATAPYLHNGSVPTLADLLKKPADRPVTWKRGDFTVDTTVLGDSNVGHEFGTDLSPADKEALIAYLESL